MLSRGLTVCLLLIGAVAFSQEKIVGRLLHIDHIRHFFGADPKTGDLLVFTANQYYAFNPKKDKVWRAIPYKRNDLEPFINYPEDIRFVPNKDYCLFLRNGGGIVYQFKDSSLLRVDNSFLHRNQFGSAYFSYRDKLYNYGGYGFYLFKGYLTEFSLKNPEWFIYYFDKESEMPEARSYPFFQFDSKAGKFYISSGVVNTNPSIHRSENKFHNDVWVLDMASRKWRSLGFLQESKKLPITDWLFFTDEYTYLPYPLKERNFCRVSIARNRLECFESKNKINQTIQYRYRAAYSPQSDHFVIARKRNGDIRERLVIEVIPRRDLEYKMVLSRPYYFSWRKLLGYSALLILVLASGVLLFRYRKRLMPSSAEMEAGYSLSVEKIEGRLRLVYNGLPIEFTEEHEGLIRLFLENDGRLSNLELYEYVRRGIESNEVLKKRKNRLVKEINDAFKFISRLEHPFLEEAQDPVDRRFKEYRIYPDYMDVIRRKAE